MGVDFDYKADGFFTMERILEIRQKARESFEGFSDFSPVEAQHGFFEPKRLPDFERLEGIDLVTFDIQGYLVAKDETLDIFSIILERGRNIIADEAA